MVTHTQEKGLNLLLRVQAELSTQGEETSQYCVIETTGLIRSDCSQAAMVLKIHPHRSETLQPSSSPISAAAVIIAIDSTKNIHSLIRPINACQQFFTTEQK